MSTPSHPTEQLAELALGTLPDDERRAAEQHLEGCARCRAEVATLREGLAALPRALDAVPPPPHLREALLARVTAPPARFARFAERVSSLVDVTVARARELLARIDEATGWEAALPGVQLMHLPHGPACAGANVGFLRLDPGAAFPHHRHCGEETVLVLGGACRDSDGTLCVAGDVVRKPPASEHSFAVESAEPLYLLAVVDGGIEIGGVRVGDDRL